MGPGSLVLLLVAGGPKGWRPGRPCHVAPPLGARFGGEFDGWGSIRRIWLLVGRAAHLLHARAVRTGNLDYHFLFFLLTSHLLGAWVRRCVHEVHEESVRFLCFSWRAVYVIQILTLWPRSTDFTTCFMYRCWNVAATAWGGIQECKRLPYFLVCSQLHVQSWAGVFGEAGSVPLASISD